MGRTPDEQPTINLDELLDAMTLGDDFSVFLDLETGAVEIVPPSDGDLWDQDVETFAEQPERFVEVEQIETRQQYQWMREFAAKLDDAPDIAALLDVALEGRGAFGRFRGVLDGHPDLQARWDAWQAERALEHAKAWLARQRIRLPLSSYDASDTAREPTKPTNVEPQIGLVHVLLLGAPDGKTELLDGRVLRQVTAPDDKRADQLFRRLVRDACALDGIEYRRSLVDGRDRVSIGDITFVRRGTLIEVEVEVSRAIWDAIA